MDRIVHVLGAVTFVVQFRIAESGGYEYLIFIEVSTLTSGNQRELWETGRLLRQLPTRPLPVAPVPIDPVGATAHLFMNRL